MRTIDERQRRANEDWLITLGRGQFTVRSGVSPDRHSAVYCCGGIGRVGWDCIFRVLGIQMLLRNHGCLHYQGECQWGGKVALIQWIRHRCHHLGLGVAWQLPAYKLTSRHGIRQFQILVREF